MKHKDQQDDSALCAVRQDVTYIVHIQLYAKDYATSLNRLLSVNYTLRLQVLFKVSVLRQEDER